MRIQVLPAVAREIEFQDQELKESIYGALERLEKGEHIPMPLCRPLPKVARGLYELRFSSKRGEYRVFYFIRIGTAIYVIHAMQKKSQTIPDRVIDLLKARIRGLP